MERFARLIEQFHAGLSPNLEKHARNILALGEMIDVCSRFESLAPMLPEATRSVFSSIYPRVRPNFLRRQGARLAGRLLMRRAAGKPRQAVPVVE